jgi:hypothetical protein
MENDIKTKIKYLTKMNQYTTTEVFQISATTTTDTKSAGGNIRTANLP